MSPIEYRFKSALRQLASWLTWAPVAQRPLILAGAAYTGNEVQQFRHLMMRARTLMTPSEILCNMDRPGWTQRYWVVSSAYGDVIGGRWGIFLKTQTPLKLQCAASGFSMDNAIADQYLLLGNQMRKIRTV